MVEKLFGLTVILAISNANFICDTINSSVGEALLIYNILAFQLFLIVTELM